MARDLSFFALVDIIEATMSSLEVISRILIRFRSEFDESSEVLDKKNSIVWFG